jgi:hypothetical protein
VIVLEIALLPLALGSWPLALGFSIVNAIVLAWLIKVEHETFSSRHELCFEPVAQLRHRVLPMQKSRIQGITKRLKPESQNARKPTSTVGFPAKSITSSAQSSLMPQALPNSSRATPECRERADRRMASWHPEATLRV